MKESLIGQCAFEKKRILLGEVPDDFLFIATGMGAGAAPQRGRPPGPLRGRDEGGHRARVVQAVQLQPPDVPRSAHGERRRDPQHDLVEHANRGAPAAAQDVERRARGAGGGAQRQGGAARGQEPGGRAREPEPRGEGRAAAAHLQVQERVSREHVARAADAAQQPAHPLEDAGGQPGRKPDRSSR